MAKTKKEFNKKEAKEKVLKTEIGKRTHKILIISLVLFLICIIASCITMDGWDKGKEIASTLYPLINILTIVVGTTMCYFDGKMDGLIASHKK